MSSKITKDDAVKAASSMAEAKRFVGKAATEYRRAVQAGERAGVTAAYATHAAVASGYLALTGKGKSVPKGAVGPTEYGAMFPNGEGKGLSRARITQLATAGRLMVVHGLEADSREVKSVLNKYGDRAKVREVVGKDTCTPKDVTDAIAATEAEAKAKREEKARKQGTGKGKGTVQAKVTEMDLRGNAAKIAALEILLSGVSGPSPAEAKRLSEIRERITVLLSAEPPKAKGTRNRRAA